MDIRFEKNGIYVDIEVCENGFVALHNCSAAERPRGEIAKWYPLVELQGSGYNHNDHHASKHSLCAPGSELRYVGHSLTRNEQGDLFEIVQATDEIEVKTYWQFYDGVRVLRAWSEVTNIGNVCFPLEYISSFALTGIGHDVGGSAGDYSMAIPHNTWFGECQWKTNTLHELGYDPVNSFSMKRIAFSSTGTWACSEHLPMGAFLQKDGAMLWQIETTGSWCWEVSDLKNQLYLRLSGPSWQENQFLKRLNPGETFVSVPCALTFGCDFEDGICEMTAYRRRIRRPNADNEHPSVIQSVTDQDDYVKMAAIACNCMTAVTPEQAAIWSYPKREGDEEETIYNMVSAMLLRIHQSGHLAELSKERLALVSEGIATHMEIVDKLKTGMPFWPIGLGAFGDPFLCVGVRCENEAYMAVWHTCEGEETIRIPMRSYQEAELIYPKAFAVPMSFADGALEVTLSGVSARLFRLW